MLRDQESSEQESTLLPLVLVVDDERLSLQTLRRTLEEEFTVLTADNVADAEKVLSEMPVQVVLSDQRMPDMSGCEFLARVRHRWPDVVRLMISAYTDPADLIKGINDAGIYQFIPKPWQPEHLLLTLRNAARSRLFSGKTPSSAWNFAAQFRQWIRNFVASGSN